jgi:pyruvate kinase
MLSGETAVGRYPVKVVQAMSRICEHAEQQNEALTSDHRIHLIFGRVDEAIAMATMYTANHLDVAAIASLTESGATVLWMSRISSGIPIYALTRHHKTQRKVALYRGVYPVSIEKDTIGPINVTQSVVDVLLGKDIVATGQRIIMTRGDLIDERGAGTNTMKIVDIPG